MTARQALLAVHLPRRRALGRDDFFVSAANERALAQIDRWREWPNGQLALSGPEGAGKTHLAHVWMEDAGAEAVAASELRPGDAAALAEGGAVVAEDIDADLPAEAEQGLFHLINLMRAEGRPLLLTARSAPSKVAFGLRDLASRVAAMPTAALEEPDDALMRALLVKQFADRHIEVSDALVAFLLKRVERSAGAARSVVAQLDDASAEHARALTIPFVKEVLDV